MQMLKVGFSIKSLDQYSAHVRPFLTNNVFSEKQVVIFHLNTLFHSNCSDISENIKLIDLTKTLFIKHLLKKINVDAIIFFSPGQIFDIFFVQACNELNIKTIYFQHGISLDFSKFSPKILDRNRSLRRVFNSLTKFIYIYGYVILNLPTFKQKYKLISSIIIRSKHVFFTRSNPNNPKYGLKNNHCEFGFVYGELDKKYLIKTNNYNANNVFINSYPFLEPGQEKVFVQNKKKIILYISSGLLASHIINSSKAKEKKFYIKLVNEIISAGFKMAIKLHPLEDLHIFEEYLKEFPEVDIFLNKNLADLTIMSDLIIGDYSTALFYAIKYLKPIILLQSDHFEKYPFDFSDYHIGKKCFLRELSIVLKKKDIFNVNKRNYFEFQKNYLSLSEKTSYENFSEILSPLRKGGLKS